MDLLNSDFDDILFNDRKFLIKEIQRQSDCLQFVPKSGKSEVWNRFVRIYYKHNETDYVKCVYCEDIQKQTQYSGTSGLLKHRCQPMMELQEKPNEESEIHIKEDSNQMEESFTETNSESSPLESIDFYMSALQSCDPLISLRRHKGKSCVWNRFDRIFYNNCETKFVKCKHCDDVQKHCNGYGTGALLKHRCGVFDDNLFIENEDSLEENPLNNKTVIKEMVKNNDQRISFVKEIKKSEVWNRFERIFIDDFETLYVKCKYCECVQKQTRSGGTQGLRKHRCPSFQDNSSEFKSDEKSDSFDEQIIDENTINDEKDYIKHLTEENNTLKQIVEKCLNIIDDCLCVNKYSSQQRREVNVLVNKYNKLFKLKSFAKMSQNEENVEINERILNSNKFLSFNSNNRKSNMNSMNEINLYRKKFKRRQQMTNSIKNKYEMRYICDWTECGKRFRLEKHLKEHRDTIHLNIKNHDCQWPGCEESFLRKSQLNVHILKYHSNARFSCDQCSYKTTYKGRELLISMLLISNSEDLFFFSASSQTSKNSWSREMYRL